MKMFFEYLSAHKKSITLWAAFSLVFAIVFRLYKLPGAAVLYSVLICFFIGAVWIFADFKNYRERRIALGRLLDEITLATDNLPPPKTALEEDYQKLLITLFDFKQALANEMDGRYADMADYYTLWAHQIKTPIAAMRLNLQGADFPQTAELDRDLQRIEQYVEMALCYTRLDSETNDFLIKKYDLDGIVRQAVRKFSSQFIGRKIRLVYEPVGVTVLTDEKWLLFVLEQILSNALKYTKSGEIEITLEEPKTVVIRDTGIGIAPEDINRIFEKSYTGCNGRTDKKASGIGLYLCRQICGRLGHKITARSQVGVGTEIRINLAETDIEIE
ncbi:MAG: sensor histidine kinase [Ruminococcus sp.]|nr:sensor histidine kinase [Ruminococcus sp.]MCM1478776.1 sensor histidine kinase [Muribaculaceae bacterium]